MKPNKPLELVTCSCGEECVWVKGGPRNKDWLMLACTDADNVTRDDKGWPIIGDLVAHTHIGDET